MTDKSFSSDWPPSETPALVAPHTAASKLEVLEPSLPNMHQQTQNKEKVQKKK